MKKCFLTGLLVVAGWMFAVAQDSTVLTLKGAIETALKNNIDVKQTGLLADRDLVNHQQAKWNVLPDLNGNFNFGWNQGRTIDPFTNTYINQQLSSSSVGLTSNVVLFSGLQLYNAIRQTSYAFQASKMDYEQSKNTLTLNVLLTYLQILNGEDLLEISRNQAAVTRKQVERMQIMVNEGAVGEYNLTDLKGQLAGEEIAIINGTNTIEAAKLSLCQMLNIPMNKNLKLVRDQLIAPAGLYELTAEQVYQEALRQFAAVKATDLRVKSFQKSVNIARGGYFPVLSFGANIGSNYSSAATTGVPGTIVETNTGQYVKINNVQYEVLRQEQNFSFKKIGYRDQLDNNLGNSYGFNLRVPIFNNFFVRNQVRLASINLKNSELENQNIKLTLRQNIETAYSNMASNFERYKALASQVQFFETSFRAAEIRFNTGVINSAEYLIVKNNLDRAKVNLITATYEYLLRTRILDFYQGKLSW
jgi:outer membrane protein